MRIERIREISDIANRYLSDHIGDAVSAETPRQEGENSVWTASILCNTEYGYLRCGFLQIDSSGNVIAAPSREELVSTIRRLKQKLADA